MAGLQHAARVGRGPSARAGIVTRKTRLLGTHHGVSQKYLRTSRHILSSLRFRTREADQGMKPPGDRVGFSSPVAQWMRERST